MILYRSDGQAMTEADWQDAQSKTLAIALDGRQIEDSDGERGRDRLLLLLNAHFETVDFNIPPGPRDWQVALTSAEPENSPEVNADRTITVEARSLLLLRSR
jgi:glycogen operon protein